MEIVEEVEIACPRCGEVFSIEVETTRGEVSMIEDCAVCCRPMTLLIRCRPGEVLSVDVAAA